MITSEGLQQAAAHAQNRPSVVSIGVFDGVHLGHRAILQANVQQAKKSGLVPTVVTFSGHPKKVLLGHAPRTLTTLQHRLALFRRAGIEHTLVLQFDQELRETSAQEFLQRILKDTLNAREFVLGFDSKFGKDQRGSSAFLEKMGESVQVVERVSVRDRAISSTAIREAVELGDIPAVCAMLGRRVSMMGQVVHGDAVGRTLGFPTANLNLDHELHPPVGVYAGFARILSQEAGSNPDDQAGNHKRSDNLAYPAMANIGFRPSLTQKSDPPGDERVEVHLIGFDGDLYGSALEFEFVARLRNEQHFENLQALRGQIETDQISASRSLQGLSPDFGAANFARSVAESGPDC